jgi:hypothetical protein
VDIAAVQQDIPQRIDFDRELTTVGTRLYFLALPYSFAQSWTCCCFFVTHPWHPPLTESFFLFKITAVSNMVTGSLGIGFTGSYIFSQTVFTMRAGIANRANGWVVAALEAAIFLYPHSVVQYLPNYFLGALLVWFGVEIARDWLIHSYWKLTGVGEWPQLVLVEPLLFYMPCV